MTGTTLCRASPGAPRDAGLGAITFLHRFGAALNTHFHYHIVVLDGVFAPAPNWSVQFHHASQLTPAHWLELQPVIQHRVLRYFRTQGLLDGADANGVLAPNANLRASVVAIGRPEAEIGEVEPAGPDPGCPVQGWTLGEGPVRPANPARIRWAILLTRIYGVLPLLCPACGGQMKVLAWPPLDTRPAPPLRRAPLRYGPSPIPPWYRRIGAPLLLHLDLPHPPPLEPPPLSPARGPPQGDFLLDQTSEFDPTEPDPEPEFIYDQSAPEEFED